MLLLKSSKIIKPKNEETGRKIERNFTADSLNKSDNQQNYVSGYETAAAVSLS